MFPVSDVIPPRSTPVITIALIITNALAFAYQLSLPLREAADLARSLGAFPGDMSWPALFSSLFLHVGWLHVGANMLYLWLFGPNVEDSMGHAAFLVFYLSAGGLGVLAYTAMHPSSPVPLIGGTAAVGGVLGAYFVLFPNSQVLTAIFVSHMDVIEVPAFFFAGVWILIQLIYDWHAIGAQTADPMIALGAQLAGIAAGVVTGGVLRWRGRRWG